MAANNQGIAHLRLGQGRPARLACKRRNAHIAVPFDRFEAEPRRCKRCDAYLARMRKALELRRDDIRPQDC